MAESRREVPRFCKDGSRHKKNSVQRECEVCKNWVSTSQISVDHINPVVSVDDGFVDWNEFVDRLWCDKANLQRICDPCHDTKTQAERIARLTKQYTAELDDIEHRINDIGTCSTLPEHIALPYYKEFKKELSKYTAKKKTIGLEKIVQRALDLKNRISKGSK
jgi:hypothetical protein